ncbi:hypothetical protein D6783_03435 [Candidatus Woesearchaeota archaeon]|nr:MAG: hypothetical protein D6783_03435 [Candidatus Woesearchaeota archaeon]
MELPIRLIIVLFVSILVASSLIVFARDIIKNAKNQVTRIDIEKKEQEEEKTIKLSSFTEAQLEGLIRECYKRGKQAVVSTVCFAVKSINPAENAIGPAEVARLEALNLDGRNETADVAIDAASLAPGQRGVWIEYNIATGKVEVG